MSAAGLDTMSRPALLLVSGRGIGLAVSFAIGVVLARIFDPADFGTYRQFFLIYATLYGIAQLGMVESLYYFVPRQSHRTGPYVANAMATLALAALVCMVLLYAGRAAIASWLSNTELAQHSLLLGAFLAFTLVTTVFEIVLISRKRHLKAAVTYAISDIARTLLFIVPALAIGSLRAVFVGAAAFAAIRFVVMLASFWRAFGHELRIDLTLWRQQLGYALPFALSVAVEIAQINYHQYFVASQVDTATFAIYAIGCLQIPLVELIVTSTVNVLMVRMAEDAPHSGGDDRREAGSGAGRPVPNRRALALWHDTVYRLSFLLIPLAVFLIVTAHQLIVGLFTSTYASSVAIFRVWALVAILPPMFAVDAVLRVYAQTRFLLLMNVIRLVLVAASIGWFMSAFGLRGAVIVTLITTMAVKLLGAVRVAALMHVHVWEALPWARLAVVTMHACVAAMPVVWLIRAVPLPPLAGLMASGTTYAIGYFGLWYAALSIRRLAPSARTEPAAAPAEQRAG